jgi:hypothetical protein
MIRSRREDVVAVSGQVELGGEVERLTFQPAPDAFCRALVTSSQVWPFGVFIAANVGLTAGSLSSAQACAHHAHTLDDDSRREVRI